MEKSWPFFCSSAIIILSPSVFTPHYFCTTIQRLAEAQSVFSRRAYTLFLLLASTFKHAKNQAPSVTLCRSSIRNMQKFSRRFLTSEDSNHKRESHSFDRAAREMMWIFLPTSSSCAASVIICYVSGKKCIYQIRRFSPFFLFINSSNLRICEIRLMIFQNWLFMFTEFPSPCIMHFMSCKSCSMKEKRCSHHTSRRLHFGGLLRSRKPIIDGVMWCGE